MEGDSKFEAWVTLTEKPWDQNVTAWIGQNWTKILGMNCHS
jgi:hypothetical protein